MGYHLLLASDHPDISQLLARALRREGHDVDVHDTTDPALSGLTSGPDLILLDAGSTAPGSGSGTCWRLRAAGTTLPILLLTNRMDSIDLVVAQESGADGCLAKPFRSTDLLARIEATIFRGPSTQVPGSPIRTCTSGAAPDEAATTHRHRKLLRVPVRRAVAHAGRQPETGTTRSISFPRSVPSAGCGHLSTASLLEKP